MFDPKCAELARYFLVGRKPTKEQVEELAQSIQNAVEDWIFEELAKGL